MDKRTRNRFKEMLLAARQELLGQNSSHAINPGDDGPTDLGEKAATESTRELLLQLRSREADALQMIDDALAKIEDGSFGKCELCGVNIPMGRLKVMPWARFCIECKSKIEKGEIILDEELEEHSGKA